MKSSKSNGNGQAEVLDQPEVKGEVVTLPQMKIKHLTVEVVGTSPLIVHNFSEKSKAQILGKQKKEASKGREKRDPEQEFLNSIYWFQDKKRHGFPAIGFKKGMVRAGKHLGMVMTDTRCAFHVLAQEGALVEIKPLVEGEPYMREDYVRLSNGSADLRFRACYNGWSAMISIEYDSSAISQEQLCQLLDRAGFSCGIGENRPEKSGDIYGRYEIKK